MDKLTKELGKEYKMVMVPSKEYDETNSMHKLFEGEMYDIEWQNKCGQTVVVMSKNCYGEKSGKWWFDDAVKLAQRIILLDERREMAYHNMYCYEGKEGYADKYEFEKERGNMIEQWLCDLSEYKGKNSEFYRAVRLEFDIHEIFVDKM